MSIGLPNIAGAAKKKEKTVGTVKIEGGGSVKINGKTAGNGAAIAIGDTIVTGSGASVKLTLSSGKEYIIDAGSRIKLLDDGKGGVRLLVVYGGSHPAEGSNESIDPLPYIGAFGFGNFPSTGGGNSSNGNVMSVVLPSGAIAFFDSAGNFVR